MRGTLFEKFILRLELPKHDGTIDRALLSKTI
jgi:hypothetical protein